MKPTHSLSENRRAELLDGKATPIALERHFTPKELGKLWGFSEDKIREMFREVPGVLKVGHTFRRSKNGYLSIRIPESVAVRVHQELSE